MLFEKETLHLILLNAGAATHEGDWNWNDISSPFFRIYLVKEGEAWVSIGSKQYTLTPGHLYLIPPFTLHSDSNKGHFKLVYFHVYEETLRHVSLIEQLVLPFEVEATELDTLLVDRLLSINPGKGLPMYDPKGYDNSSTLMKSLATSTHTALPVNAETYGILWQLFARFLSFAEQREPTRDSRIQGVTKYIREHIDQNMSIGELASQCYLSDDHFIRIFRKEMHQTPIDYINQKKIEKAQLLLVVENRPIKDIACALSFDNVSYFNRLFKKLVGKTPGDYRKTPY